MGATLEQLETDFVLQIANLPADARLRDVQLERGAGNVFLPGHGDEITKMAQFHAASMPYSYAQASNMVFLKVPGAGIVCS